MKTLSIDDVNKIDDQQREIAVLVINHTVITYKQGTTFVPPQVLIKNQQPGVSGLRVASFTDQNSGLRWTGVNTLYMEAMNHAQ